MLVFLIGLLKDLFICGYVLRWSKIVFHQETMSSEFSSRSKRWPVLPCSGCLIFTSLSWACNFLREQETCDLFRGLYVVVLVFAWTIFDTQLVVSMRVVVCSYLSLLPEEVGAPWIVALVMLASRRMQAFSGETEVLLIKSYVCCS